MLKNRSVLDEVSSILESNRTLFRGYIYLGSKDIQVQSFDDAASYLK